MPIAPNKLQKPEPEDEPIDAAVGYAVADLAVHMFAIVHYRQVLTAIKALVETGANRKECPFSEEDAEILDQAAKSIRRAIRKANKP